MNNKNNPSLESNTPNTMSRKSFLRLTVGLTAAAGLGSLTGCGGSSDPERELRFASVNDALQELALIENNLDSLVMLQEWTLFKVMSHLAATTEGAMIGFPEYDTAAQQAVNKIGFAYFKSSGYMSHDLTAPVPGDDAPLEGIDQLAIDRLRNALMDFKTYTGTLYPHFAYGDLEYDDWILAIVFHCADHFQSMTY